MGGREAQELMRLFLRVETYITEAGKARAEGPALLSVALPSVLLPGLFATV